MKWWLKMFWNAGECDASSDEGENCRDASEIQGCRVREVGCEANGRAKARRKASLWGSHRG